MRWWAKGLVSVFAAVALLALGPGPLPADTAHTDVLQPANVHGDDDRVQIQNTTDYPWSAIAYLDLYDAEGYAGNCTGTFIGPDAILTAGHCLYDEEHGWTTDVDVYPGANGDESPFGGEFAFDWWVPDAWLATGDPDFDWGVISMPDSTLGMTVGWLPIVVMTTQTLERPDFLPALAGYPADKPYGTMWYGEADAFATVSDFYFEYDIDTAGGQSGSAIFSNNAFEPFGGAIVGIHAYGANTLNSGTRIDDEVLDDLLLGCQEMGCTIEYYHEGEQPLAYRQGDANCSGVIDNGDVAALLAIGIGLPAPGGCDTYQDDVDCLGGTGVLDALAVAIYLSDADPLPVNGDCPPIGAFLVG